MRNLVEQGTIEALRLAKLNISADATRPTCVRAKSAHAAAGMLESA
jgi:hypothetical protein